jgi:hypothetical protein
MDIAKYWTQAQELNWRCGLFRIWIVFSVGWFGSFTIAAINSYIEDVKKVYNPGRDGTGLFDDIPVTNPPASVFLPSDQTIEFFLIAFLIPLLVYGGGRAGYALLVWICGGFKIEKTESLNFPVLAVKSPRCCRQNKLQSISFYFRVRGYRYGCGYSERQDLPMAWYRSG